jgi:hypothetical protein
MANYLFAYRGGAMADTPEAQQEAMNAWMSWFGSLGEAVVDMGAPFGPSASVSSDGTPGGAGASGLTGYSVIAAEDLSQAQAKAKGCPVLANNGSVDIYEALAVG